MQNVYQAMIAVLKAQDAPYKAVKHASDNAWDYNERHQQGESIESMVNECLTVGQE